MKKLVSTRTISPTRKIIRRQARSPKRKTLSDLPEILFEQTSSQFKILEETEVELFWPMISLFQYKGLVNLTLPYRVQLRRLNVPSDEKVWIGFCKGYITNSFTICTGEPGTQSTGGGGIRFGPTPVMIIEAGHPISEGAGSLLKEQSEIKAMSTSQKLQKLQLCIIRSYNEYATQLPHRRKRNPMMQRIGGRFF